MHNKLIIILLLFIASINLFPQQQKKIIFDKIPAPPNMVMRVEQFDQFSERFNYEKDFYGNTIDSSFATLINRKEYIKLLFSNELLDNENKESIIEKFLDTICNAENEILLDKYSDKIIIEADSKLKYNGNEKNIKLYF